MLGEDSRSMASDGGQQGVDVTETCDHETQLLWHHVKPGTLEVKAAGPGSPEDDWRPIGSGPASSSPRTYNIYLNYSNKEVIRVWRPPITEDLLFTSQKLPDKHLKVKVKVTFYTR